MLSKDLYGFNELMLVKAIEGMA